MAFLVHYGHVDAESELKMAEIFSRLDPKDDVSVVWACQYVYESMLKVL
jgi:hypothetical protein